MIVVEVNDGPINSLTGVFSLFQFEHVFVEMELKSFIGIVDAKLFKTVHSKILQCKMYTDLYQ